MHPVGPKPSTLPTTLFLEKEKMPCELEPIDKINTTI